MVALAGLVGLIVADFASPYTAALVALAVLYGLHVRVTKPVSLGRRKPPDA